MKTKNIFKFLVIVFIHYSYGNNYVEEVFKWRKVEYENLPKSVNSWIGPYKYYIPENNDISSMAFHPATGLMTVAIARLRPGVPTSLGAFCVNDYRHGSSPKIWAFPSYRENELRATDFENDQSRKSHYKPHSHNKNQNQYNSDHYGFGLQHNKYGSHNYVHQVPIYQKPSVVSSLSTKQPENDWRIISAFHTMVDEKCNRVFIMDNGQINYYRNMTTVIQNPALIIIDIPSDCCETHTRNFPIIRRAILPNKIASKGGNGMMNIALDYQSNSCDDFYAYITNAFSGYLIVYDFKRDEFWPFDHLTMKPVIEESLFVHGNDFHYQMKLGLFSLVLGYPDKYGDRTAYYTSIASTGQYAVSTKVLKNKRNSPDNFNMNDFRFMGYLGCDNQPLRTAIDYTTGVMFYGLMQTNKVLCWNMKKTLNPDNIGVVYESDNLKFDPEIFIDSRRYLWFLTDQIPILYYSDRPLNINEVNSRIFRIQVDIAIRGTVCEDDGY